MRPCPTVLPYAVYVKEDAVSLKGKEASVAQESTLTDASTR